MHVLADRSALILLQFERKNEKMVEVMDNVTSRAIRFGGSIETDSRASLDAISPFLAKRITGEYNLPLQEHIKKLFDPNDCLASNRMFNVRQNSSKSAL